jgi:hypothetical protein
LAESRLENTAAVSHSTSKLGSVLPNDLRETGICRV